MVDLDIEEKLGASLAITLPEMLDQDGRQIRALKVVRVLTYKLHYEICLSYLSCTWTCKY